MQQRRQGSPGAAVVLQGSGDEGGVGLQEGAEGLGVGGFDGFEGGLEWWVAHQIAPLASKDNGFRR